jgi:hypothetical protein
MLVIVWCLALLTIETVPNANAWFLEYPDNYFTFGHHDPSSCSTVADKIDTDGLGNVLVAGRTTSEFLVTRLQGGTGTSCYGANIPFVFKADLHGNILWEYYFSELSTSNSSTINIT